MTRASVVGLLERCTSFTATFTSWAAAERSATLEAGHGLGLQAQTLPQLPKPIYRAGTRYEDATLGGTNVVAYFLDELESVGQNLVRE